MAPTFTEQARTISQTHMRPRTCVACKVIWVEHLYYMYLYVRFWMDIHAY